MQEMQVLSLDWEETLKKEIATTPVFLPGKFHEQRSLAGYSPWRVLKRVEHDLATKLYLYMYTHTHTHINIYISLSIHQFDIFTHSSIHIFPYIYIHMDICLLMDTKFVFISWKLQIMHLFKLVFLFFSDIYSGV